MYNSYNDINNKNRFASKKYRLKPYIKNDSFNKNVLFIKT